MEGSHLGVSLVGPNRGPSGDLCGPGRPPEEWRRKIQVCTPHAPAGTHRRGGRWPGHCGTPGWAPMTSAAARDVTAPPPPTGSSVSAQWQAAGSCTSVLSGIS